MPTRHAEQVYLVALVIDPLHERERNGNTLFGTPVDVDVSTAVVDPHHTEIHRIDAHQLSAGVAALWEERFIDLFAQHTHLAPLCQVHVVDEAAIENFRSIHLGIFRHQSSNGARRLIVACHHRGSPLREHGSHHVEFRHLLVQAFHILVAHAPRSPFAEPAERFGGGLGKNNGRVVGEALEVALEQLFHAVAPAHQSHEHEHPPEDAEAREQGTAFVAREGVENFAIGI